MLGELFTVSEPEQELKDTRSPTSSRIGISQYLDNVPLQNSEQTRRSRERERERNGKEE